MLDMLGVYCFRQDKEGVDPDRAASHDEDTGSGRGIDVKMDGK